MANEFNIRLNKNNSNNSNNINTKEGGSNIMKIILICLAILFVLVLIYVGVNYYNYSQINCYQKRDFTDYLFSTDKNVCILFDKPIPKPVVKVQKETTPKISNFLDKKETQTQ